MNVLFSDTLFTVLTATAALPFTVEQVTHVISAHKVECESGKLFQWEVRTDDGSFWEVEAVSTTVEWAGVVQSVTATPVVYQ